MKKIKPTLVLFLICVIATGALAYFNSITKDIIAEQAVRTEQEALQAVMPGAVTTALSEDEVNAVISQLTLDDENIQAIYRAEVNGTFAGYIFNTTAKGYGGVITVITGIDANGAITGTKVIDHSETAGLGAKSAVNGEGAWINQYFGKTAGNLSVVKSAAAGDNEIIAITSATRTSRAVTRAVNIAGKAFELLMKGGN